MLDEIVTVSPETEPINNTVPDIFTEELSSESEKEEPVKKLTINDIFIGKGDSKVTVKDIKKKINELSKTVDLSDITKPDCENKYIHTRSICTAYIIFVLISLIGLIGIFIWKYCRGMISGKHKNKEDTESKEA